MPGGREQVDDGDGEQRAGEAGQGSERDAEPLASAGAKVIASIAPSAAPADTPSVNGVASGLRSSPWKTTPAVARVEPTSAPASVRGSRAMKKICASGLSANGTDQSKARRRLIGVDPISGAVTRASSSARAEDQHRRRVSACRPAS